LGATDGEHAPEDAVQPAAGEAVLDRSWPETERRDLASGYDAMLQVRKRCDGDIRRPSASF
jgi:hypothetical protein